MTESLKLSILIPQIKTAFAVIRQAIPFAFEHKLWTGFFKQRWMAVFSIITSIIFSYIVISEFNSSFFAEEPATEALSAMDMSNVKDDLKGSGRESLFSGGIKYLLLILLEVVIFYFSIKTMASLRGKEVAFTFKDFVKAEKRMIKVMFINYIYALMAHAFVVIALSITGAQLIKPVLLFLVYAYFIGYAFLDNFFEQQGLSIDESKVEIQKELGAALTLGVFASMILHIPLIGPLFAPIIFAIAATLYGAKITDLIDTNHQEGMPEPALKST